MELRPFWPRLNLDGLHQYKRDIVPLYAQMSVIAEPLGLAAQDNARVCRSVNAGTYAGFFFLDLRGPTNQPRHTT
jgi:hypothetical protein